MEAKFTKGPWNWEHNFDTSSVIEVEANAGVSVCSTQSEYDAYLIAAAPDLYEALDNFDAYASTDVDYIGSPFQKEVRAALAKARGES